MLDMFGMPTGIGNTGNADTQIFTCGNDNAANVIEQIWVKPRGKNFLYITCIGSGAGGGGGAGAAIGSAKAGGGGGGSGGITHFLYMMYFVPDVLHVFTSPGGAGGVGGTSGSGGAGAAGKLSFVAVSPLSGANNLIFARSSNAVAGTGQGGTTIAAGSAGPAATINVDNASIFCAQALIRFYVAGAAGSAGGGPAGAIGAALTVSNGCMFLGGTGGGGSTSADFVGGTVSAVASTPYGAVGGAIGDGDSGFRWGTHPLFYGGSGGGASNSIAGGRGGNGVVPGVGGGGGGGGITNGGRGGDGGPGLIIMTSF